MNKYSERIFECIDINIDDKLLKTAKIASYMSDQTLENPAGKEKPYTPKSFPNKAVIIQFNFGAIPIEIYFDSNECAWNSAFIYNDQIAKLSEDQLDGFFKSDFYKQLKGILKKNWPLSDEKYQMMFNAIKDCNCSTAILESEVNQLSEVDQQGKRKDLANKDINGDNHPDYSNTGRKIIRFSDMGMVSKKKSQCYCWPRPGKEFKWNTWKDWRKIKPLCKIVFTYNNREYMLSCSVFDEQYNNRGFRGADIQWTPPFAWLTKQECQDACKLTIVKKFLKVCMQRVKKYIDMDVDEIYKKINRPDMISKKEIEKTIKNIKHTIKTVFTKQQADNYKYDD